LKITTLAKQILILTLCFSLCIATFGCNDQDNDPKSEDDEMILAENGESPFIIVRGVNGTNGSVASSILLQKGIMAVSDVKLTIKTDYGNEVCDSEAYEILIGNTSRPESSALMKDLDSEHSYAVKITDRKIILVGKSDEALRSAVEYFLSEICGYRTADDYTRSDSITLDEFYYKGEWIDPELVPDDGKPDVLYGLSQEQVDELFSDILDGLFTGKTKETITERNIGASFGFHFPDIVYKDGNYMAYYITYATKSGKGGVGLAISKDGENWENKGCVIEPEQDFDCNGAYFAGVWLDTDGSFYLTYECKGGENTEYGTLENIALATSSDGYNWENEGVIIYADHSNPWQRANVGTPDLYKVGDTWYVLFHGFDYTDCRLGVAYGKDLHDLTVLDEPIIDTADDTPWSGTIGRRDVIFCNGYYYMVYEISTDQVADGGYGEAQWSHMFARSKNLIDWEITSGPLLTQEKAGFGYDGPCWMIVGRHIYVYMREGGSTTAVELKLSES
jgi:predicted GH43/DUF377 family glycosyl hydrolase